MTEARQLPIVAVLALGIVALVPACRGATLPPGSTDPIRIGVVLTLDLDGEAYREALELATREANAAGGPLPGRAVELVVAESMNDPVRARNEAERLLDEGVVAIIGDGGSTNTLAIAEAVTTLRRVPHLSCSSTSPSLTELNAGEARDDRFFFRTAPSDTGQALVLADVAATEGACTRVAILHQNDDYGTPIAEAMRAALGARSVTVTSTTAYEYGRPSYDSEVAMAVAGTPDCVAILGYPQEAGLIVRAWSAMGGPMVRWIGSDALNSPMFAGEAGGAMRIDGFLGTGPRTAPDAPEYLTFRERLRAGLARPAPYEPEAYTASCYDAAALLYLALAEAGTTEGDAVRDALRRVAGTAAGTIVRPDEIGRGFTLVREGTAINYEGASGSVDFDEFGDVLSDYTVWRYVASSMTFDEVRIVLAEDLL